MEPSTAKGIPAAYDSDVDKTLPAPTKVHIRGLDNLTTSDIEKFAAEYYLSDKFRRVEWIDDSSANIAYETADAAREALLRLSSDPNADALSPLQLRRAQTLASRPDVELQIRQATLGDAKAPRAREKSRFYLMNPEHDPGERRKRHDERTRRPGYGRRTSGDERDDRRNNRRKEEATKAFDESMYDDDAGPAPQAAQMSRRESQTSYSSGNGRQDDPSANGRRTRAVRFNDEDLLGDRSSGRLRDRSASPVRDGDGRYGFSDDQPKRKTARQRSATPPRRARELLRPKADNSTKELFGPKPATSALDAPMSNGGSDDPSSRSRELFPHRTAHSNHRRSDALDGRETADLIAKRKLAPALPFDHATSTDVNAGPSNDLASRITGGRQNGRLGGEESHLNGDDPGFSIKGTADAPGFSIRGASRDVNAKVKELFPTKAGNDRKDLFADRMGGKAGGQRRRAEDLF